jgi:hypothetical protein
MLQYFPGPGALLCEKYSIPRIVIKKFTPCEQRLWIKVDNACG